jgi:HD-like signal output (HDOD) protein
MTSIVDAVMVLGFGGLRSLLLASGTAKHLQGDFRCYGHDELGLWKHSLVVACCAKTLGVATGQDASRCEELFIAGLLHDIGKMLLAPYLRNHGIRVAADQKVSDVEKGIVGLDHAEAGALVVGKWGLGPAIQDVLSHVPEPEGAEDAGAVAIIRLAEAAALDLGIGYEPGAAPDGTPDPADLQTLGIDGDSWNDVRASLDGIVDAALSQLENLCA